MCWGCSGEGVEGVEYGRWWRWQRGLGERLLLRRELRSGAKGKSRRDER